VRLEKDEGFTVQSVHIFYISVGGIRTGFSADPDPASQLNTDPDPGQTLLSQKS
jgi:hypothetical protein